MTLALAAALADWFWGTLTATLLTVACVALPVAVGALLGVGPSSDPRNFVGSSGLTFALAATLAGALVARAPRLQDRALGLGAGVIGLAAWWWWGNAHGLVTAEGLVLGILAATCLGTRLTVAPAEAAAVAPGPTEHRTVPRRSAGQTDTPPLTGTTTGHARTEIVESPTTPSAATHDLVGDARPRERRVDRPVGQQNGPATRR